MSKKIIIENTRRIKHLEFTLPEKKGVYLLVAPNGVGKSTLLTVLHRICNGKAFAEKFKTSSVEGRIDDYRNARITYIVDDNKKTTFSKKEKRWVSSPKRNIDILSAFGFENSYFIEADPKRIAVKADEIKTGKSKLVAEEIRKCMSEWFCESDFMQLEEMKSSEGRGRKSASFYVVRTEKNRSYSEKQFSTGELAILRLLSQLESVKERRLLLFDEAELALHPRVQLKLLDYLRQKCEQKHLTVLVSTHSRPIIEYVHPSQTFLIEKDEGTSNHRVITPCYPARALGNIIGRDFQKYYDAIIFVNDEMSKLFLKELITQYLKNFNDNEISHIQYVIYPVGDHSSAVKIAKEVWENESSKFFVRAVLDHNFIEKLHKRQNVFRGISNGYDSNIICDLGSDPERDIIGLVEGEKRDLEFIGSVEAKYNLRVGSIIQPAPHEKNKSARDKFSFLIGKISYLTDKEYNDVKQTLLALSIKYLYPCEKHKEIIGKIFAKQEKP